MPKEGRGVALSLTNAIPIQISERVEADIRILLPNQGGNVLRM